MLNAKVDDQAAKGLAKHEPTRGGSQIQWKRKAKGNSRRRLLSMMLAIPSRAGGRARRTEAAVDDGLRGDADGRCCGRQPYGFVVVVMIAGARFHARTAPTASQDSSRACGLGGQALTRASSLVLSPLCAYLP